MFAVKVEALSHLVHKGFWFACDVERVDIERLLSRLALLFHDSANACFQRAN